MSAEQKQMPEKKHSLSLEGRQRLKLEGVEDVRGFDDNIVILVTGLGELSIKGEKLHIDLIDLASGNLELRGHIQELSYDEPPKAGGAWKRFFG